MLRRLPLLFLLPACIVIHEGEPVPDELDTVIIDDSCPGDPAWVTTATVDGDDLVVDVGYGGCDEVPVWACWNGQFAESFPPQILIEVHHADAGDCDAAFETTARFSLDPVIDRYDQTFIIHVGEQTTQWDP